VADLTGRMAPLRHLEDPFADFVRLLDESHGLIEETYRIDRDGGFTEAGSARARDFTLNRLAAGSQLLLSFWYTAWMESAD
jgi:hypothetical protein